MNDRACPYEPGDFVVYRPSPDGYARTVMHAPTGQPIVGQRYRVARIVKDFYVVCDGFEDYAGLYWTEFEPAE